MAQNITVQGASYADVPAVVLPKTGGGTASFTDVSDTTAAAGDVASGKYFYTAAGVKTEGTASGGGGQARSITNILGNNVTLVTGYLNASGSIVSAGVQTKEVTTDYIDISAYAGQKLQCWNEIGGNVAPWVGAFFYNSSKTAIGSRRIICEAAINGSGMTPYVYAVLYYGSNTGTRATGAAIDVPSNAQYIRVSFRTNSNASLCITNDTTIATDYWDTHDISTIAFVNALESDGTAT